jgi:glutamate-1-semialdehyde 2,1-aminomutase
LFNTLNKKKEQSPLLSCEKHERGPEPYTFMKHTRSAKLFTKAKHLMPGGVNSPVRAFKAVGGSPVFIKSAKGSKIYDVDGNEYIDYVLSWGPMILGHTHPRITKALQKAAERGTSYGAPTGLEIELAGMIRKAYPSMEIVRMVNSGTEATMSAIRVARGFTGRDKVIKFEGCYHGHADGLLVKAGSGAATFGVPTSPGVPRDYARHTITLPFNDRKLLEKVIKKNAKSIACVILEPVIGNSGCVLPKIGFLQGLRRLTQRYGIILIFDEVMTGFRVSYGGAQKVYRIKPDMTCLGKVIGGGLPVGAYGGRKEIMRRVAPDGPIYQAGTLSGNPLAMTAGIETLRILSRPGTYKKLNKKAGDLEHGLKDAARRAGVKTKFYRAGTMFCTYFTDREVHNFTDAANTDTAKFAKFFRSMLERGVNLAPSAFEAGFISLAHTHADINKTVRAAYESLKELS